MLAKREFSLHYRSYNNIFAMPRSLGRLRIFNFLSVKCQIQPRVSRIHSGWYFKIHFQGERLPFEYESGLAVSEDVSCERDVRRCSRSLNLKLNWMDPRYTFRISSELAGDRSSRAHLCRKQHHGVPPPRMNWISHSSVADERSRNFTHAGFHKSTATYVINRRHGRNN